ncbi:MAG: hypothetical protein ACLFRG_22800 [Desulfococcaceae bacterium]
MAKGERGIHLVEGAGAADRAESRGAVLAVAECADDLYAVRCKLLALEALIADSKAFWGFEGDAEKADERRFGLSLLVSDCEEDIRRVMEANLKKVEGGER